MMTNNAIGFLAIWIFVVCCIVAVMFLVHFFGWYPVGLAILVWPLYSKEMGEGWEVIVSVRRN